MTAAEGRYSKLRADISLTSIAFGNFRNRRRQYLLLTVAIMLALYFVTTMLLFASTMFTSLRERHYQRFGEQDIIFFDAAREPMTELLTGGILTNDYGKAAIYGYVMPDGQSKANGFSVAVFDEKALALARKDVLAGRLPERAGEIALEQSMLARLRTKAELGDTLALTLAVPDGVDFLDSTVQKNYKLVGIISDKLIYLDEWNSALPVYRDFPAGILSPAEEITAGGKAVINVYGRYADSSSFKQLLDLYFAHTEQQNENRGLPFEDTRYVLFADDSSGEDIIITYVFLIIIVFVLVLAACLGIINAFTSNLEARKQQLGLLRAVGATQKQLREILGRETSLLALFSIPLALLFSCLTVWGLTKAMGESYIFRLNALVLLGVATGGFLCVRLAASIPLRAAAKVSPMQAIRNVELARIMRRSKIASEQHFDVPLLLAKRSRTLYQNKRLGITAMLSVTIVLMSLVVFFAEPLLREADYHYGSDYYLRRNARSYDWLLEYDFHAPGITEQDKEDAAALFSVKTVRGEKVIRLKLLTDKVTPYITNGWNFAYLTGAADGSSNEAGREWRLKEQQSYLASKEKYGYKQDYLTVDCYAIDYENIEKLAPFVAAGSINPEKLAAGKEILIVAPTKYGVYEVQNRDGTWSKRRDFIIDPKENYTEVYQNDMFQAGDTLTISLLYSDAEPAQHGSPQQYDADGSRILPDDVVRIDRTVTIGAILEMTAGKKHLYEFFDSFYPEEVVALVTTAAGLQALGFDAPYSTLAITLSESPDAATEEYLEANLSQIASRTAGVEMVSLVARTREKKRIVYGTLIAATAIIILFFTICASMVNNALSARIRAGKREIGTIRAVGASQQVILSSYLWQLAAMFGWGTIIGMTAELALCLWLQKYENIGLVTTVLPTWQPLLFAALLFALCYLNIRAKVKSIVKDSIVANIREL